jgi:hypothetical protein
MLKRYQVLLPDWLEEHIEYLADRYDLSISEVIRGEISFSILSAVMHLFPEYKPDISTKEILNQLIEQDKDNLEREQLHRVLSKIYFETRKAIEYWQSKDKNLKKK